MADFFANVGDAFRWVKDTGAPAVGGAFSMAGKIGLETEKAAFGGIGQALMQTGHALGWAYNTVERGAATGLMVGSLDPYTRDSRSALDPNTWREAWNLTGHHVVNDAGWVRQDDGSVKLQKMAGQRADVEGISVGQLVSGAFHDFIMKDQVLAGAMAPGSPDSADAAVRRQEFFHNTWQGRLSSGGIDFALNIVADPTAVLGKVAKGFEVANATLRSDEAPAVFGILRGDQAAERGSKAAQVGRTLTGRQSAADKAVKAEHLLDSTMGKSVFEISREPFLRGNVAGGDIAYVMKRADEEALRDGMSPDAVAKARRTKLDALGALFSDRASVEALKGRHGLLAAELDNLMSAPQPSIAVARHNIFDGGQGVLLEVNRGVAPEIQEQADRIVSEMARLNRVVGATGTGRSLSGTYVERMSALKAQGIKNQNKLADMSVEAPGWLPSKLRFGTVWGGMAARPVVMMAGALGSKLESHVNIAEPTFGVEQLRNALGQSPHLDGATQARLLDAYVSAGTRTGRMAAVKVAEDTMIRETGRAYGFTPDQIESLMAFGDKRRTAIVGMLKEKSRLYTAADSAPFASFQDPDTGILHAVDWPILQTQTERFHSFIDPLQLDRTLKAASGNRMLELAVGQIGEYLARDGARTGEEAAGRMMGDVLSKMTTSTMDKASSTLEVASSFIQMLTKLWKDATLLGRFPAYVMRSQLDSQLRLRAFLGTTGLSLDLLKFEHGAIKRGVRSAQSFGAGAGAMRRYYLSRETWGTDHDEERLVKAVAPWMQKIAGFTEDEAGMLIRDIASRGGSFADLASEAGDHALTFARTSGDWGYKEPTDRDWLPSYIRAVNREIRYSPTAMAFVAGKSRDEIRREILTNPKLLNEWNEVKTPSRNNLDEWLDMVEAHVDHYLPNAMLREWTLRGIPADMQPMAVEKLFAAGDLKEQLIRDLNLQVPAHAEIADIAAAARDKAMSYRDEWRSLNAELKDLQVRKAAGNDIAEYDEDDELVRTAKEVINDLVRQKRVARANWTAASAGAKKAAETASVARRMTVATETEARGVQAAQNAIANPERTKVTQQDVIDYFTANGGENRMRVHGESYTPKAQAKGLAKYEELRNAAYHVISDVPETIMARLPLFMQIYNQQMRGTMSRMAAQGLSVDSAAYKSIQRQAVTTARQSVSRILFDSSDSSNLGHHMRLVMPFFAAWEDTMRKWGSLVYENPAVLERIRQSTEAPAQFDVRKDQYGNLMVPATFIPKSVRTKLNIGDNWRLDPDSINSVFQGEPWWLPSFGPLVVIPINTLVKWAFPEHLDSPIVKYLLPFGVSNKDPGYDLLPAYMKRYADSAPSNPLFGDSMEFQKAYAAVMQQEWSKYKRGERDDPMLHFDEMKRRVRNRQLLRGFLSQILPFTVSPTNELQFYFDQAKAIKDDFGGVQDTPQFHADLARYEEQFGKTARDHLLADHPEYTDWYTRFIDQFPGYEALAVGLSTNDSGLVATMRAVKSSRKYKDTIEAYPDQAWMMIGPDNAYGLDPDQKFSQNAYTYELDQSLRSFTKDPVEAIRRAEVRRGWAVYSANRTKLNLEMERRGVKSLSAKGATDLQRSWHQFLNDMGTDNKYWAEEYLNSKNTAQRTLDAAVMLIQQHPEALQQNHVQAISDYINARTQVMEAVNERGGTLGSKKNADLKDAWDDYVGELRKFSPGFEQIWNRSLRNDTLTLGVEDGLTDPG